MQQFYSTLRSLQKPIALMYATFNTAKLPILFVTFGAEPTTPEEFKTYLETYKKHLESNEKLILIFDASKAKYLSAEYRIMQGKWLKDNKDLLSNKALKMIFVIPSLAINLLYKTILAIQPLPAPNTVVKTMEEALAEAEELLVVK